VGNLGFIATAVFSKNPPSYFRSTRGRFLVVSYTTGISSDNGYPCPQYIYRSVDVTIIVWTTVGTRPLPIVQR